MRRRWLPVAAAALAAIAAIGGFVVRSSGSESTSAAREPQASTALVERGPLSDMVSQYGTLTYRARPDGTPYLVINRAHGTYTQLPDDGDKIACGDVLYRVNDRPVLLLCGSTPAYRALARGESGRDVAELNANLVHLGYAPRALLDPSSASFGSATASALEQLQSRLGEDRTGSLELGRAVFLPEPVRIAQVTGELGGSARPGAHLLHATSEAIEVQLNLDPSQQGEVEKGDRARITLPGNTWVSGKVDRLGRVARVAAGQDSNAGAAIIPAYVSLDDPRGAAGLDRAPVRVEITTRGVASALSVPVTALVGKSGGGFAVEVVGTDGRRELVGVKLGLFDTAGGRVEVEGRLRVGDHVVVPSP